MQASSETGNAEHPLSLPTCRFSTSIAKSLVRRISKARICKGIAKRLGQAPRGTLNVRPRNPRRVRQRKDTRERHLVEGGVSSHPVLELRALLCAEDADAGRLVHEVNGCFNLRIGHGCMSLMSRGETSK